MGFACHWIYTIFPFFVVYCPQKFVLTAFQFSKEWVCQVQSFAVMCKDWENHSSVALILVFKERVFLLQTLWYSFAKAAFALRILVKMCFSTCTSSEIRDPRYLNSWQTYKGCLPRNTPELFRFAEYLALWSMICLLILLTQTRDKLLRKIAQLAGDVLHFPNKDKCYQQK